MPKKRRLSSLDWFEDRSLSMIGRPQSSSVNQFLVIHRNWSSQSQRSTRRKMSEESFVTAASQINGSITSAKGRFQVIHIEETDDGEWDMSKLVAWCGRFSFDCLGCSTSCTSTRNCSTGVIEAQWGGTSGQSRRRRIERREPSWIFKTSLWLSRWDIHAHGDSGSRPIIDYTERPIEYSLWCLSSLCTEYHWCDCFYSIVLGGRSQRNHRGNDHHWSLLPLHLSHSHFLGRR